MFDDVLQRLGINDVNSGVYADGWIDQPGGEELVSLNPATGEPVARVLTAARDDYERVVESAQQAFRDWRMTPAPVRGEFVRRLGMALREHKRDLGLLVTLEMGKIQSEGEGEVQEMIDMCDFSVGLSRQLYGLTIASERPQHRMMEQWHPLGVVGILSAFNFPVAVWAWNAAVAAVCGNATIWKPSPQTPLTAIAVQHIVHRVSTEMKLPPICGLAVGAGIETGQWMAADERLPLISATGSCDMGRAISPAVAQRLGRCLLELGGNNAIILTETADLDLALRGVLFAAVGTSGQRCTSLRRLIVHESNADAFVERLANAYKSVNIGKPWEEGVLMGPLANERAAETMMQAVETIRNQGGEIVCGGNRLDRPGYFVEPTIVRATADMPIVATETFAPILYVLTYKTLDEAIEIQNSVAQGLSSAIFTDRMQEA
ncbi:MAG: aldehyde dehydrogenase family protein, partial [Planctomycetaceae bacterium]|nr:aldehyde dehydrogenase family protein [Planctomycetaceae bacterium]